MHTSGDKITTINIKLVVKLVLLTLGLIGAAYTSFIKFESGSVCNINSFINCSTVNSSEYSEFLGIPVAFLGVLFILFNFAAFAFQNLKTFENLRKKYTFVPTVALVINLVAALGSIVFIFLQLFIINAICLFCLSFDISTIIYTVLLFIEFSKEEPAEG
jgi:uncharacterized membrane protein